MDGCIYAMPYVEAGSLRDRLRARAGWPVDGGSRSQPEVASALTYAHALGIVHRDLKPENIMLSPAGHALLADFGIAYAIEHRRSGPDTPSGPRLTETGVALGTPAYMSPEQSAGDEALDGRSDHYSLAAVVFEALVGRRRSPGRTRERSWRGGWPDRRRRAGARPTCPSRSTPRSVGRWRDSRRERFESACGLRGGARAGDHAAESSGLSAAGHPGAGRPSDRAGWLVVALVSPRGRRLRRGLLGRTHTAAAPAAAGSGPGCSRCCRSRTWAIPADQYFADGLTEELTSRLAGARGLRVISRTSAEQYRASTKSLEEIGAELGAGYVLEGSVRWERGGTRAPGRIRVTPPLIPVAERARSGASEYEVELTEVFRIQSEIAQQVTAALDVALRAPSAPRSRRAGTATPEAYDFYLRGNDYASAEQQPRQHQCRAACTGRR